MCGIAGILSLDAQPVFEREIHRMCGAMHHRGPDDEGIYLSQGIGLGMRRLSIIDVASGHQPVHNEDCTIWVVFNGEIYNFRGLRRMLEARGHDFYTNTDTETIVHLYEEFGKGCVQHLRGMFAFALWDERRRELLVARDRLGIKPLYYTQAGGRLLFASELKSLLQLREVEAELSWTAVSHLLSFLSTPPEEAILAGVRKLEPGHLLTAAPGRTPSAERYWNLHFEADYSHSAAYLVERLRELLDESVRLHMISDVPVGAFLSGGIDSSTIVATASRLTREPLQTFSIGFDEPRYDEREHAREVAAAFSTNHRELMLGPGALDHLEDLAWHLDEPFGDSSAIPTYLVSKLAAERVKVVLSGDGGDELFAGYDKYAAEECERCPTLPPLVRRLMGAAGRALPDGTRGRNRLRHFALAGSRRYVDSFTLFRGDDLKRLLQPDAYAMLAHDEPWRSKTAYLDSSAAPWLSRLQELDLGNYLPLDILTKVDRMSMAHSIETRVPLLDHKLVEFAATIPPEFNLSNGTGKHILKLAMRGILPDRILNRRKQGFAVPLGYWFRGGSGGVARDLLLGERSRRRGIFQTRYVERLIARHERGEDLDLHLWTLMSFELWARIFLDRGARTRACEAT